MLLHKKRKMAIPSKMTAEILIINDLIKCVPAIKKSKTPSKHLFVPISTITVLKLKSSNDPDTFPQ